MAFFIFTLLLLLSFHPSVITSERAAVCDDREESSLDPVSVLEGESGWISCPVISDTTTPNTSSSQDSEPQPVWYRCLTDEDLEPVTNSSRVSRDGHRLWFQPSKSSDSGLYICVYGSPCRATLVRLKVLPLQASEICKRPVAVAATRVIIPLESGDILDCPDLAEAAKMADGSPSVTWYKGCNPYPFWKDDIQPKDGVRLQIHNMLSPYSGVYFCRVQYRRASDTLTFTRSINVTAVYPISFSKVPSILQPSKDHVFSVTRNSEVRLVCRGFFPYLDSPKEIWWTVDGSTLESLGEPRYSETSSLVFSDYGDQAIESVLVIQKFHVRDLDRTFNCSVRNQKGFQTRQAQLMEEARVPALELGCGFGIVLILVLFLFLLYHVFWLDLMLIYRTRFGIDERRSDNKDYDIYISYARNSEEEEFVLTTLHQVLETDLGYSVCIFDRDSLPGGTITDETLGFVARSRRLLVVVSPGYASQGSQALLELKAGIDGILGGHLRVILVQYKQVHWQDWVKELRTARVALALVRWQGEKSRDLASRFWKRLRVELPVRSDEWGNRKVLRLLSQSS